MAKFTFIGDPADAEDQTAFCKMFGITFPRGEAIEVMDAKAISKLSNNSHFAGEGIASEAPKRRGRPPKAQDEPVSGGNEEQA